MSSRISILLLAGLAICPVAAYAQNDLKDAMMAAIDAPDGRFKTELRGDFAAHTRRTLNTTSAVFADVKVIRSFKKEGCKRLRADITAPEVRGKNARGEDAIFHYVYEMNLCRDGSPPVEGMLPQNTAQ